METTRKSKVDFPPARISESDMLSSEFLQTRISIEVMAIEGALAPELDVVWALTPASAA
jgi:hypothetical protein